MTFAFKSTFVTVAALVGVVAALLLPASAQASSYTGYIAPGSISLDGEFEDWPAGSKLIDETTSNDVNYDYWCYNTTARTWAEVEESSDCTTYLYSDKAQIDIRKGYFGMNQDHFFLGMITGMPLNSIKDMSTGKYREFRYFYNDLNVIDELPKDFHHHMLFAFGKPGESGFTHYLVADFEIDKDLSLFSANQNRPLLKVYKETNGRSGWQSGDTLLGQVQGDDTLAVTNMSGQSWSEDHTLNFELRGNVKWFLDLTGLDYRNYTLMMTDDQKVDTTKVVTANFGVAKKPAVANGRSIKFVKRQPRGITVDWNDVTRANRYKVQLQIKDGSTWKSVNTWANVKASKKVITKSHLIQGETYRVRVKACNETDCSAWTAYKVFATPKKK